VYIRCTYGISSREITIHTVIYGADIRFWPTLSINGSFSLINVGCGGSLITVGCGGSLINMGCGSSLIMWGLVAH